METSATWGELNRGVGVSFKGLKSNRDKVGKKLAKKSKTIKSPKKTFNSY